AGNQVVIIVLDGAFSLLLICWSVYLIGTRLAAGAITPGEGMAAGLLLTLMLEPLNQVAGFFYIGMGGKAAQRAITQALAPQASPTPISSPISPTDAVISIQHVSHDYGRGPVLRDLSLEVPRGTKVAILGSSGAGKSTLLGLLRGTVPIQSGTVVLAGQSMADLPPEAGCQLSASVAQTTWLFAGSVADNLRMAHPSASDDELWEALRRARVADEVARMPKGLASDVGERGQLISGGQAQRLSLARALLSGRRILLLDEPTSQVDVASETAIVEALREINSDWTVIVVTHRRSLLAAVDTAYELADGTLTPRPLGVSA
ncbi:MAG: ATP-binding cassette domain-containing protein, partial [Propionibacteriaceae bacterium]|nr:ATP-binding cassette domain-containing protein [Propionibacteriaceae bacterium]